MYGADADELDRLAFEMSSAADDIEAQSGLLTQMLRGIDWIGGVAARFTGDWDGHHVPAVSGSVRFLREAAQNLQRQASEQRQASGIVVGVGSGFGVGPQSRSGSGSRPGGGGADEGGWDWFHGEGFSIGANWGGDERFIGIGAEGSLLHRGWHDDAVTLDVGRAEGGLGIKVDGDDTYIGAFGEVSALSVGAGGTVIGDEDFGGTLGAQVDVLKAEAIAGYHDGSIGASAGVDLVSVEGSAGVNIGGANVGVTGGIGLKFELGASIGKHTKLDLGPVSIGFDLSW